MFETHPKAEYRALSSLTPESIRTWSWIELAICIPVLLATLETQDGDEADAELSIVRHLWFTRVDQIIDFVRDAGASTQLVRLDLLSPSYMNGTDGFKLDQLHQIWRNPKSKLSMLVVLKDGRSLSFDPEQAGLEEDKLELVLSV